MADSTTEEAAANQLFFYQETKKQRSVEGSRVKEQLAIDSWQFSPAGGGEKVKLDFLLPYVILPAIVNKDPTISPEVLLTTKQLITDPSTNEVVSEVLQLEPKDYRQILREKYKRGEIPYVPNYQVNLRPLLIVDLIHRLKSRTPEASKVLHEWEAYWKQTITGERLERFFELLLDAGYINGDPVTEEDRIKLRARLKALTTEDTAKLHDTDLSNRQFAEKPNNQIEISPTTLFHETDFSSLPQLLQTGILANEIVFQSRNHPNIGESTNLSTSFWRFEPFPNAQVSMNLREVCSQFYPVDTEGMITATTGASLRDRIVIGSIDPSLGEEEFYLSPPYVSEVELDKAKRYGALTRLPFAQRFMGGTDFNYLKTSIEGIHKDCVLVLLGIPKTKINFCIIPERLKNAYVDLAKSFAFYLPAYSRTGELLNPPD